MADPSRTQNGAREFRRVILKVVDQGYDAFGILCEAVDVDASPRKRKRFERELLALKITQNGEQFVAHITGIVDPLVVQKKLSVVGAMDHARSAIDDHNDHPPGDSAPERKSFASTYFPRDQKVRDAVIRRAKGKFEHCQCPGFTKDNGKPYLEAHHIISLSKQGPDTLENVIALCANHHREAHFGENWLELESKFKAYLAGLKEQK
jgi:5-methylcytosine-specific restriction enzyme A